MNIIERVKNILTTPKTEWDVINNETPDTTKILTTYVIPLVAIGTVLHLSAGDSLANHILDTGLKAPNWVSGML